MALDDFFWDAVVKVKAEVLRFLCGPFLYAELEKLEAAAVMGPLGGALRAGYGIECDCPVTDEIVALWNATVPVDASGFTAKITWHAKGCPVMTSVRARAPVTKTAKP